MRANLDAIIGSSFFNVDSELILTVRGFLVDKSVILISPAAESTDRTVPAILRNEPETIASALMREPSSLFSPNTRRLLPTTRSFQVPGLASEKRTESGA